MKSCSTCKHGNNVADKPPCKDCWAARWSKENNYPNWESKMDKNCHNCKYKITMGNVFPCEDCANASEWVSKENPQTSFTPEIKQALLDGKSVWYFDDEDEHKWIPFKLAKEDDIVAVDDSPTIYAVLYGKWSLTKPKETKTVELFVTGKVLAAIKVQGLGGSLFHDRQTEYHCNKLTVSYEE
jgi:hypothetical protein